MGERGAVGRCSSRSPAGSILYVVIELLNVLRGAGSKAMVTWGMLLGLVLGFGTDFILVATGV